MKRNLFLLSALSIFISCSQESKITSPDGNLIITLSKTESPTYSVLYKNDTVIQSSPLGLYSTIGDFSKGLTFQKETELSFVKEYTLNRSKVSKVNKQAKEYTAVFTNANNDTLQTIFYITDNDIAIRYRLSSPNQKECEITGEATSFDFPQNTKTIITPQAPAGSGWMKSKPSYEEEYTYLEPIGTPSRMGLGYTFPALFQIDEKDWVLISETGVDGNYVGCKLSEGTPEGRYTISFPEKNENREVGSNGAKGTLPMYTSWKTITVGNTLNPIIESTVFFDVVEPKIQSDKQFLTGKSTWSWILWQDASCNFDDQVKFIDLASEMGYEYILVDALWDTQIGDERMPELIQYATSKNVNIILWYNSNGTWNDAPQGPKNRMSTPEARQKAMEWMETMGVKGIKVDFFGGDKQCTMQLYEDILTDAAKHGIAVNFHGATLPRGWERMYPNFMACEAVLASENLVFSQYHADKEAYNATIIPFTRNAVASMDFGPVFFNKRFSKTQERGTIRKTTDAFELATSVLYHSAVQHFGITPNNLTEQPNYVIDFMKNVPTTWDETRFIDGFPGKYCVIARRSGDKWYIAAVNGEKEPKILTIKLPEETKNTVVIYGDKEDGTVFNAAQALKSGEKAISSVNIKMLGRGGAVVVY